MAWMCSEDGLSLCSILQQEILDSKDGIRTALVMTVLSEFAKALSIGFPSLDPDFLDVLALSSELYGEHIAEALQDTLVDLGTQVFRCPNRTKMCKIHQLLNAPKIETVDENDPESHAGRYWGQRLLDYDHKQALESIDGKRGALSVESGGFRKGKWEKDPASTSGKEPSKPRRYVFRLVQKGWLG